MSEIIFDIAEDCRQLGRHAGLYKIIHLYAHYKLWGNNDNLLIESITSTIAHEEIHIILRSFNIPYTNREESILKRIKHYLFPMLTYMPTKEKDFDYINNKRKTL